MSALRRKQTVRKVATDDTMNHLLMCWPLFFLLCGCCHSYNVEEYTAPNGTITSPNYPQSYPGGTKIRYFINVEAGQYVEFTFNENFNLETGAYGPACSDHVSIYDRQYFDRYDLKSVCAVNNYPAYGRFCSTKAPAKVVVKNSSAVIEFCSMYGTVPPEFIGFELSWQQIDPATIKPTPSPPLDCGVPDPAHVPTVPLDALGRIDTGGKNIPLVAEEHSWPWMAAIFLSKVKGAICGGVLLQNDWVLTTGFCGQLTTGPRSMFVKLGAVNVGINASENEQLQRTCTVREVYISPKLENPVNPSEVYAHSVALLKIHCGFGPNKFTKPICLPKNKAAAQPKMPAITTGWGNNVNSTLRQQIGIIQSDENCPDPLHYGSFLRGICAEITPKVQNGCSLRPGNPLMVHDGPNWFVVGLLGTYYSCVARNLQSTFLDVTAFLPFIREQMAAHSEYLA